MNQSVPILPISDVDEAMRFYKDILGFDLSVGTDAHDEIGLVVAERLGMSIQLDSLMPRRGIPGRAFLRTSHAKALCEEWWPKLPVQTNPDSYPWEPGVFCVKDPFKNLLFVAGPEGEDWWDSPA